MRGTICRTEPEPLPNPKQGDLWEITNLPPGDHCLAVGSKFELKTFIETLLMGYWPTGMHAEYKGMDYTVTAPGRIRDGAGILYKVAPNSYTLKETPEEIQIMEVTA